jgi:CRP/FNR family cyclic AMP-dependent transcriptional regulator
VELVNLLRTIELFSGLNEDQLKKLAALFVEKTFRADDVIFEQGTVGDSFFIIQEGFVEIVVGEEHTLVNLGPGQIVGEMALVDRGTRSATVRAATQATVVHMMSSEKFDELCETDTAIGYHVMHNIAADLSFKLRHRNLEERGGKSS